MRSEHSILLLVAAVALAAGCSSTGTNEVNEAVMARWESLTDEASRRQILDTRRHVALQTQDYRIGPEDVLAVSIFEWELREETRTIEARVSQSGFVSLPIVGNLRVLDATVSDVQRAVEGILHEKEILKAPRVSVVVKEFQSKRVSVVGAVQDPGVYTLHQNVTTLLDVLALAGGPAERAGQGACIIRTRSVPDELYLDEETGAARDEETGATRDDETGAARDEHRQRVTVDLYELLEMGNLSLNMVLEHGDIVHVPEAPLFFVFGFVREPGGFSLKRPTTVLDAVALARGLRDREASPSACILKRRSPAGETVEPLDLVAIARGEAANHFLKAGDIIEVGQTPSRGFFLDVWDGIKSILSLGFKPIGG